MAKKSYDQRLKERWKRKQKQGKTHHDIMKELSFMENAYAATAWIMPFLFGKRNR